MLSQLCHVVTLIQNYIWKVSKGWENLNLTSKLTACTLLYFTTHCSNLGAGISVERVCCGICETCLCLESAVQLNIVFNFDGLYSITTISEIYMKAIDHTIFIPKSR